MLTSKLRGFTMRLLIACIALSASPILAEPVLLADFLSSIDRTEVRFSGAIRFNRRESDFTFYDEDRNSFGALIDAGRDMRERVEQECEVSSMMVSYAELCSVSGKGTVEVRGSRIFVSIEQIDHLAK
jgi:hypothetical protein